MSDRSRKTLDLYARASLATQRYRTLAYRTWPTGCWQAAVDCTSHTAGPTVGSAAFVAARAARASVTAAASAGVREKTACL